MQRGSIIIFTVLMLSAILAITLTLTRIFIPKIRAITEAADSVGAVYAADICRRQRSGMVLI
ncbi:MAG: hypothetical protein HYX22_00620 [Candidatus Yanofskybacteria bacterium]|nr:hypothetical protein [Candidatus Yanofskybacteria bacterium]